MTLTLASFLLGEPRNHPVPGGEPRDPGTPAGGATWLFEASAMPTAKLFPNGRSQAVRRPPAFRFAGTAVPIRRFGLGVLLEPATICWFAALDAFDEPFMANGRDQPTPPIREVFGAVDAADPRQRGAISSTPTPGSPSSTADRKPSARLRSALERGDEVAVPVIARFELWHGLAKIRLPERNTERLAVVLAPFETLPYDEDAARHAGTIRAWLERAGTPFGPCDRLIAAQALRHGRTLIAADTAEFARVAGLCWAS